MIYRHPASPHPLPNARWLIALVLCMLHLSAWSTIRSGADQAAEPHWSIPVDKTFNLYRMQPDLYRSALPTARHQGELRQLGIATVINFYKRSDAQWLSDPSVRQIHQPLHTNNLDDEDVLQALRSIRLAQLDGPVLIHCRHGQHRTGVIAAMYRIVYQGWSKQQAMDEMHKGGFGGGDRFANADQYLEHVDLSRFRSALVSGACSTSPWAYCALKEKFLTAFNTVIDAPAAQAVER